MRQTNFFPVERNRYFFGKLLTERDFNEEQDYFNNKRRLLNRFIHGMGVVSGLGVIKVDDKTISVEAGIAIDGAGRELISDTPSLRKLTMIDGYEKMSPEKPYVYLCMEYDEEKAGNDNSPANPAEEEFSKYHETYRIYLTQDEPKESIARGNSSMLAKSVLYQGEGLLVKLSCPKVMRAGETGDFKIIIENYARERKLSLGLKAELSLLRSGDDNFTSVKKELYLGEGEIAEIPLKLTAFNVKEGARAAISFSEFELKSGGRTIFNGSAKPVSLFITEGSEKGIREREYYEESFERIFATELYDRLYLARIRLVHTADTYMIERVDKLPFGQWVLTDELIKGMFETFEKADAPMERAARSGHAGESGEKARDLNIKTAHGTVVINLGVGGKAGQRYYSEELVHGLGTGPVDILLSVEKNDMLYSGDRSIFEAADETVYTTAAKLDQKRGTFVIGIRAEQPTSDTSVTVHWTAVCAEDEEKRDLKKRIYILPEHIELRVYGGISLQAKTRNLYTNDVLWRVNTEGGGSIDENGVYMAPGIPGVYEVEAVSKEDASVRNTTFIIVRE